MDYIISRSGIKKYLIPIRLLLQPFFNPIISKRKAFMINYFTYILFSNKLNQYYIGSTNNIERRLNDHNTGRSKHTSKGMPWNIVFTKEFESRTDAVRLEISIKKRGAARYLSDH